MISIRNADYIAPDSDSDIKRSRGQRIPVMSPGVAPRCHQIIQRSSIHDVDLSPSSEPRSPLAIT
ncbi:hypothetical protein MJO28_004639 [Puccinia striiformis f. sp. tritici]|uniref:Uncharacterized protein n=1 Tax=Puccinia striiformis f. sp. tritici TaxID=168172 RepID=A0ACC0EPG7_9BASI|nr:hypothetical protein MJO28_004639 [Puccinia striiformis f. sp. tritici]KAI7963229.1 hypothetical protein MJO29_003656 [Puccinia striiformis f. sp. tritici]